MHRQFTHIRTLIALILVGVALLSCQKECPQQVQQQTHSAIDAWLSLDLKVASSSAETKAAAERQGGTNGAIDENAIKRLVVYLVPVADGTEDWDKCIMTYMPKVNLTSGDRYKIAVNAKLNVPMNLYVGANISTIMAGEIMSNGPEAFYESAASSYSELIGEFASEETGIAMFCTKPYSVTFTEDNVVASNPAEVDGNGTIDLIRMLAKIHMLFKCYGEHPDYVHITEPGTLTPAEYGEFGWCRLDEISYIINTVNRSTRFFQPAYDNDYDFSDYMDLNHSMNDLLNKNLEWEYKSGAANNFLSYAGDLARNNVDEWSKWAAKPERYDASRAPFGSGAGYTAGQYCLENTTDGSALASMTEDERKYVPFMVATHLIVKARFVPRMINTVVDNELRAVEYGRDAYYAALASLTAVDGVDEHGNAQHYPEGTFFTRDMQEFYDYPGMMKLIETLPGLSRKNFAAYPGGYGFYHSYINGGTDPDTGQLNFRVPEAGDTADDYNSGVYRNHYHILNCSLMKVPATPGSFNQLMMVNSKVIDWNNKGSMDLTVKPNV